MDRREWGTLQIPYKWVNVAGHYGWHELDHYGPQWFTFDELQKRLKIDLGRPHFDDDSD
jgi:hypothetical protein